MNGETVAQLFTIAFAVGLAAFHGQRRCRTSRGDVKEEGIDGSESVPDGERAALHDEGNEESFDSYRQRTVAVSGTADTPIAYARNPHILAWWTGEHDYIVKETIKRYEWTWQLKVADALMSWAPPETIAKWRKEDPVCRRYAYYNVLMNFAAARAKLKRFNRQIRKPEWRKCYLCGERFVESSLPPSLAWRLGMSRIEFCAPCLSDAVLEGTGNDKATRKEVREYVGRLTEALGRIPRQGYGTGMEDLHDLDVETRSVIIGLLQTKPTVPRVKKLYGSWLGALIDAGVLAEGTRHTGRSIQCLARDGHLCFSIGEKTIDDFLSGRGIEHTKEPRYPDGVHRADFLVHGIYVEYLGLRGNHEYDQKSKMKLQLCKEHGLTIVALYAEDLQTISRLERRLHAVRERAGRDAGRGK